MNIQDTLNLLSPNQVSGDYFNLKTTNPLHYGDDGSQNTTQGDSSFSQLMFGALDSVNSDQQYAQKLEVQSVTDPNSVDVHDVTIAMAKAELSLSITKNVLDKVIQAYKDITTLR